MYSFIGFPCIGGAMIRGLAKYVLIRSNASWCSCVQKLLFFLTGSKWIFSNSWLCRRRLVTLFCSTGVLLLLWLLLCFYQLLSPSCEWEVLKNFLVVQMNLAFNNLWISSLTFDTISGENLRGACFTGQTFILVGSWCSA